MGLKDELPVGIAYKHVMSAGLALSKLWGRRTNWSCNPQHVRLDLAFPCILAEVPWRLVVGTGCMIPPMLGQLNAILWVLEAPAGGSVLQYSNYL